MSRHVHALPGQTRVHVIACVFHGNGDVGVAGWAAIIHGRMRGGRCGRVKATFTSWGSAVRVKTGLELWPDRQVGVLVCG